MLFSTPLLVLAGLTAVQAKLHLATWRFFNHTGCQMTHKLQDTWQFMTPGGCHSPKAEAEFDEVYYVFAPYPNGNGHKPAHYGYCQLNAYSEPHCKGKVVMKWKNANDEERMNQCLQVAEGYRGVSLKLMCDKDSVVNAQQDLE